MKRLLTASCLAAAMLASPSFAADPAVKEKLIVTGNVVDLKDGKTYHQDANGKRVRMKDGVVMEGKDGRKYLHKNDVVWQQMTEKGTLAPNR
jgi:hypothetical protein